MADFMVHLPPNFRYVYEFDGGSQYKCVEAVLAMAGQVAYPDRYPNPALLMKQIYEKYVGPDVAGDRNGTTREQALEWLQSQNIGHLDMQHYIDSGDINGLHDEIMAQNKQSVAQIISIGDESFLKHAKTGHTLHNWADALNHGAHTMFRVGYSDNEGFAYYMEPAAAPNFAEPVPITWQDFLDGKVVGCIAIMKYGAVAPPADFSFQHGTWPPPPKPPIDVTKATNTIAAMIQALGAMQTAMANLGHDLGVLNVEETTEKS